MFEIENDFFDNLSLKSQHFLDSNLDSSFLSHVQTKQEESQENSNKKSSQNSPIKSFQKIPKNSKRINKNKKDDFDYDKYIKQEMQKLNTQDMDSNIKKKLVQKIRNRMSAQRSRMRQKNKLEYLEKENMYLKEQLQIQLRANMKLKEENQNLKEQIFLKPKRKVLFSTEEESNNSNQKSEQISRQENQSLNSSILNKSLFFLVAIIALSTLNQSTNTTTGNVKVAGLLSFIAKDIPMPQKQLAYLETKCEKFCDKKLAEIQEKCQAETSVQLYQHKSKDIALVQDTFQKSVLMMCVDPRNSDSNSIPKMVLIDEQGLNHMTSDEILIVQQYSKIKNTLEKQLIKNQQ